MPVAATAIAAAAVIRIVPIGALLLPAIAAAGLLIHVAVGLEARILAQARPPDDADRRAILWVALTTCFVALIGLPMLVTDIDIGTAATGWLVPIADGLVAGLLGYRLAALRRPDLRGAAFSALTYGAIVAFAASGLRVLSLPRFVEPALLVLVFYLWDAVHATEPARRRGVRWVIELAVLAILGVVVVFFAAQS
jgi:hypothetical protein